MLFLGSVMLTISWHRLEESAQSLECFCPSCQQTAVESAGVASLGLINVDIQGAVVSPGVYELQLGQRLADALAVAGGFTKDADRMHVVKTLNMSKELKDQEKIYIPFFEENKLASSGEGVVVSPEPAGGAETSGSVSINQASASQLQTLTGIGEVKSKAIIDNRPYASLEELVSKKVFSENLLNSLREQISL